MNKTAIRLLVLAGSIPVMGVAGHVAGPLALPAGMLVGLLAGKISLRLESHFKVEP